MLHSVFKSSKFYVFCQVKQKEIHMCYSYKTSLQCHNNNEEIEFLFQRRSGALLQSWCSSARVQEASRGGLPGGHSLWLHPWHLSSSFFWSWCWLCRNLTKKLPSLHHSHSSFLSVIQNESSNSSILQFNLFISWKQSKYHQPLFAKVAERSVLSRSLSYYKNTKHVALLAFLEEPSPENSGMNHGELGWQINRVTQDTLWSVSVLLLANDL